MGATGEACISDVGIRHNLPDRQTAQQCVIVLGPGRSGTSMMSAILGQLGYNMGRRLDPANHEDQDFLEASRPISVLRKKAHPERAQRLETIRQLVRRRDREHEHWGWKDPMSAFYLDAVLPEIGNPLIIALFRDVVATTVSRYKLSRTGLGGGSRRDMPSMDTVLGKVLAYQQRMINLLVDVPHPQYWVSYEKATRNREIFIDDLQVFLGRPISTAQRKAISGLIAPGNRHALS
ncbi:sulfotransferase [Limibacillus halophilus]|uniref:Sulfotransferase family protein n=1 Tax=Limibacillus halophilus TaxID=1579333 RepID=A0A839SUB4_9PROT|nr:sulfotransferase [Limibacillus halophilus]MBB3064575.1 hypothetical protein [Limibacillus halophilus]